MVLSLNERVKLVKKRKVVGRGGDRGNTSGRGMKGQKCRSGGGVGVMFEGGQMPLARRLPKRGFNNAVFKKCFEIYNLDQLNTFFADGSEVSRQTLVERGVLRAKSTAGIKILGKGTLEKRLVVHADAFSKSAAEAIVRLGGEVHVQKET
ncbi:TPA: 50S ribosomal protein L15 [Candidatus Dependentiae bacterium]|nr:MAG: 50S ribosomal protein L15 [candidate division TM6 bacterium GW2011_GWF2_43_87]HBL98448.1 50S ribosomal protein L15 [Candidatus Dependentiae bacterium]